MFVVGCNTTTGDATKYHRDCYDGGTKFNHGYNLSGLTIGDNYLFIIDGLEGANSDFYAELLSGADNGCDYILPIELKFFEGLHSLHHNILRWQTASEEKSSHFEIEKSSDAVSFKNIATISSKSKDNLARSLNYYYEDELSSSYYRLKLVDMDGKSTYSKTIYIQPSSESVKLQLFPNPSNGIIKIINQFKENSSLQITVYDLFGRKLIDKKTLSDAQDEELNLSDLDAGWYHIIINNEGTIFQEKILLLDK